MAIVIVAEIGIEMSRFPSDRHLTAWAGVALGNNKTAGKRRSGKVRRGNKYLQSGLVLAPRRGKNRAAVAMGRTLLQMTYFMLRRDETYRELGTDYLDRMDRERTVKRLQHLGLEVALKESQTSFDALDSARSSGSFAARCLIDFQSNNKLLQPIRY